MALTKEVLFSFFPKCTHARYRTLIRVFSSLDKVWEAELDDFKKTKWQDNIIHEFKEVANYNLEDAILTMMGLDPYHKQEHYGTRVRELIKENLSEKKKKNN